MVSITLFIRAIIIPTLIVFTGLLSGCGDLAGMVDSNESETGSQPQQNDETTGDNLDSTNPLQAAAMTIIEQQCAACHGPNAQAGGIANLLDTDYLISTGLIVVGDPTQGRLIGSMEDGSMPPAGPMSADDIQIVIDWVASGNVDNSSTPSNLPPLEATFSSIQANILVGKCVACHGPQRADDGIRVDNYGQVASDRDLVVPGNANQSELIESVLNGSMPPAEDGYAPLSDEEIQAMIDWVNDGALNN